jgi:type I restriction enzyme, S subunit
MNWQTEKLGKLADFRNGINFSSSNYGKGIKVIGVADFQNYSVPKFDQLGEIDPEGIIRPEDLLQEDDIVFVRSNGNRALIGRSLHVKNLHEKVTHSGFTIRLRFISPRTFIPFFAQLFRSELIRQELSHFGSGTNISNLSQETLKKISVPIPPLPEQRKIADILSTWDESIAKTEGLIAALQTRKKGLMQRLLIGGVRFPSFSNKWKKVSIGKLVKEVKRPVKWDDSATYKLISVRRRSGGLFLREERKGKEIKTKGMNVALQGDFLISKMQIVHGASGLTTKEFDGMHISNSYISLVTRDPKTLDIRFFDLLSKTPYFYHQTYLSSYGVHIEKMTFNLKDFLKRLIQIPSSIEEQKKIVELFDAADAEVRLEEQKLELLKQQKKGLMQRLLTGQVRVKVD